MKSSQEIEKEIKEYKKTAHLQPFSSAKLSIMLWGGLRSWYGKHRKK